jgi:hypothetical protein
MKSYSYIKHRGWGAIAASIQSQNQKSWAMPSRALANLRKHRAFVKAVPASGYRCAPTFSSTLLPLHACTRMLALFGLYKLSHAHTLTAPVPAQEAHCGANHIV